MKKGFQYDQPKRFDRQLADDHNDPYRLKTKLPEPTLCPQCGLMFHDGHWQRMARSGENAHEDLCPACRRTNDRFPAGYVTLQGDFVGAHSSEILKLVRNTEKQERGQHPLQRIMDVETSDKAISVTTTDIHLARRIGEALHHAYEGTLDISYGPEDYLIRVAWSR